MAEKEPRDMPRKLPALPRPPKLPDVRSVAGTVVTGALGLAVVVVGKLKRGR
ncbi:MAG: hypothetical protein H7123_01255 [Thermoleophilia bacterium]|nr:hypothetical protein [Thermoleophilia bacterium]